jgi:hypothetical protein
MSLARAIDGPLGPKSTGLTEYLVKTAGAEKFTKGKDVRCIEGTKVSACCIVNVAGVKTAMIGMALIKFQM